MKLLRVRVRHPNSGCNSESRYSVTVGQEKTYATSVEEGMMAANCEKISVAPCQDLYICNSVRFVDGKVFIH